jgi:hypothetical protein
MTIKKFDEEAYKIHHQHEKNPDIIYHYRKSKHLGKIIKNKELRFADFSQLADQNELTLGHNIILSLINRRTDTGMGIAIFNDWHAKGGQLNITFSNAYTNFWVRFYDKFQTIINHMSVYILSCTEERDDQELWKTYGDNGKGVALGFRMIPDNNPKNYPENINPAYLTKVYYEKDINEYNKLINTFLDLAEECLSSINEHEYERFIPNLACHLITYIPALKKNQFAFEKEYRIVMPGLQDKHGKRQPYEIPDTKLRPLGDKNKYHFLYNFKPDELVEIVLGCYADEHLENQVMHWLQERNSGYNFGQITISKSSTIVQQTESNT